MGSYTTSSATVITSALFTWNSHLISRQIFRVRSLRAVICDLFEPQQHMIAIETHLDVNVLAKIATPAKFAVVGMAPSSECQFQGEAQS
jgi:hypothetical protein